MTTETLSRERIRSHLKLADQLELASQERAKEAQSLAAQARELRDFVGQADIPIHPRTPLGDLIESRGPIDAPSRPSLTTCLIALPSLRRWVMQSASRLTAIFGGPS